MNVSIIVAVYNGEKYIEKCVKSLIKQTLSEIEIIIVNDGSTDNTIDVINNLKYKHKNITIINQENLGVSEARNSGIKVAKGEYIGFIDADDFCEPDMFEEMYNKATKYDVDVVISGIIVDFYEESKLKLINFEKSLYADDSEKIKKMIRNMETKNMFNFVWNKLYKKEIINDIYFNKRLSTGEDLIFNCNVFERVRSSYLINKAYYHYRRGNEDTTVTKYKKDLHNNIVIFNNARKNLYLSRNMIDEESNKILNNKCVEYYISDVLNLFRNRNGLNHKERFYKLKEIFSIIKVENLMDGYIKDNLNKKIFYYCYKINNNFISYIIYYIVMSFRYKFSAIYNKLVR